MNNDADGPEMLLIPRVEYRPHAHERTHKWKGKPMRRIGFAEWDGYPRIDDPNQDDETFAQQRERLSAVLALDDIEM